MAAALEPKMAAHTSACRPIASLSRTRPKALESIAVHRG